MNDPSNRFRFRDARPADHAAISTLNEGALPAVSVAPPARIARLAECAAYFRVVAVGEDLAGFLIAMTPEADYDSLNFRWFVDAFDSFVYVDRIVVAPAYRGRGLGERFYADLETFTRPLAPRITCEVNTRPRNDGSLRFHARLGFREVGTQENDGGAKAVSLLEKLL